MTLTFPLWLPIPKAARLAGIPTDGFYRDIRRGTCPFEVKKISGRLHVSARSLGLIPEQGADNNEAQEQVDTLRVAA
jgi:hypothetical protein